MPAPEVPAHHLEICRRQAERYARRFRLDPDHVLSDVLYHYAKQAQGKPDSYVQTIAAGACCNAFRYLVGRNPLKPKPRPASLSGACGRAVAAPAAPEGLDVDAWGLSDDGRLVVDLVLSAPVALFGASIWDGVKRARRVLAKELRQMRGWTKERVDEAFGEITEALAGEVT